jgi:MHS family proline/betaine transporter-like MFS transporter
MSAPTAAIGFLPTYESWGIFSTSLMIAFRMVQGLSMGGALTGSVSFVIEHSHKNERGFYGSISMASICIGILLGSLMSFLVKSVFSPEQFDTWAWRIPFVVGIVIYFAGIYIKRYTTETPLFVEARYRGEVASSPLGTTFRYYSFDMLISVLINATGSIIFYLEAIYLISYLKINRGFADNLVSHLANASYIVMIFVTMLAGWLSDHIGRRKIFVINLILIIFLMPILLRIIESADFGYVVVAVLAVSIMAAFYIGPEPALQAEFYPTAIRNTALSVSYNTATSVFGGTAPYIIESIVQNTGTITSSVYYVIVVSVIGLIALYFYKDRSLRDYKVNIDQ